MKTRFALFISGFIGFACAAPHDESREKPATGQVEFALRTMSGGLEYQLRNASFALDGPETYLLDGDVPDAFISVDVEPGDYTSTLLDGWQMRSREPEGAWSVLGAVLLHEPTLELDVEQGEVTPALYRFGIGDDFIQFGRGRVTIGVEIVTDAGAQGGGGDDDGEDDVLCFADADLDGFGSASVVVAAGAACNPALGESENSDDCDDAAAAINPLAGDVPDDAFVDANCDGIDGDMARAVFVSSLGNDGRSGTSPATSVLTLQRGLEIAQASSERTQVWASAAVYGVVTPVSAVSGVGIYSGYDAEFTERTGQRATVTGPNSPILVVHDLDEAVTIDGFDFVVTTQTAGRAAYVATVDNSFDLLTLRNCEFNAGAGGNGNNGAAAQAVANGQPGANAATSLGGPGATFASTGGKGGDGALQALGQTGANGAQNGGNCVGAPGGQGGLRGSLGLGCNDGDPEGGRVGAAGCQGREGTNGAPAASGLFTGLTWNSPVGQAGAAGQVGGAGGGGGAGVGENCTVVFGSCLSCGTGRGGGGGGGGGAAGLGGTGGTSGGGSIGILVRNSDVLLENVQVATANGGNGGSGGNGSSGGLGGPGGSGGSAAAAAGSGGNGGPGGAGGKGGCGGPGAGGPSIAVWGLGTSQLRVDADSQLAVGFGGVGGTSVCGTQGTPGSSQSSLGINVVEL